MGKSLSKYCKTKRNFTIAGDFREFFDGTNQSKPSKRTGYTSRDGTRAPGAASERGAGRTSEKRLSMELTQDPQQEAPAEPFVEVDYDREEQLDELRAAIAEGI